jgi:hypothetical protein
MCDAVGRQRVDHRIHHRGRGGDRADLAAPLDAQRIVPATGILRRHRDLRQVIRTRHAIIHERAGEKLAARRVIDTVLAERLADALHDAAMDLALDDQRVQHHSDIVDCCVGDETQLAGTRIDLDLGDMTAARKGEIHRIVEGGLFEAGLQDVEREAVRREIGGAGDLAECHAAVCAADREFAGGEFDVLLAGFEQVAGDLSALVDDFADCLGDGGAANRGRALTIGAETKGAARGIAVDDLDEPGSHMTPRWREMDSNPRSHLGEELKYGISRQDWGTRPDRGVARPRPIWSSTARPIGKTGEPDRR